LFHNSWARGTFLGALSPNSYLVARKEQAGSSPELQALEKSSFACESSFVTPLPSLPRPPHRELSKLNAPTPIHPPLPSVIRIRGDAVDRLVCRQRQQRDPA
jgi:hypothetical protein